MKKGLLKKQVEEILRDFPQGRDSDVWLTLKIWTVYYSAFIKRDNDGMPYVYLKTVMDLPREDNVKRIRAHFQNDLQKYLPTTLEIAKKRKIQEEVWYKFARTGNFNNN